MPASSQLRFGVIPPGSARLAFAVALCLVGGPRLARAQWQPDGMPVCTHSANQDEPAADISSSFYVAWYDPRSSPAHIYAQRLDTNGNAQWSQDGVAVASAASTQCCPLIVANNSGATVAWIENNVVRAQRLDLNGIPQWGAAGIAVSQGTNPKALQTMIWDGSAPFNSPSGTVIVWTDNNGGPNNSLRYLYAQSLSSAGTARWTAGGLLLNAQDCTGATIVNDGVGVVGGPKGVFLAWTAGSVAGTDILAQRLNASGTAYWASGGIPVTSVHVANSPSITRIASATAIVAWTDYRNGNGDVYAQQLGSSGVTWMADGLPVTRASDAQQTPGVVSDGSGGVIAAWTDHRNGGWDVYAQRINSVGAPQWALDGIPVCTTSGDQLSLQVSGDGANGMLLAWTDGPTGRVMTQRLNTSGAVQWAPAGVGVTRDPSVQTSPVLRPDFSGGAYVAWTDNRAASTDIYAARVSDQGGIAAVATGPIGHWLSAPKPNPSPAGASLDFVLPSEEPVNAAVYDVDGALVRTLEHEVEMPAGHGELHWDGRDAHDHVVPAGIYFLRFEAGPDLEVRRLVTMH